jgi:hypothetical protein
MTPKEKAEELLDKMTMEIGKFNAKQCALIAVNEIIKEKNGCSKYECYGQDINWNEVKKEIENL